MRIISANVNGIRSAYKKGFHEYLLNSGADVICVQELKAQEVDLSDEMQRPHEMHGVWHCAQKRGYSGVAIYSKRRPDKVQIGMGIEEFDQEGRDMVICGDWNIAHQNIDIKNWKGNLKNSGFLPEEREWIGNVINQLGWIDIWRTLYPNVAGYTWWSNRGQAYTKDVGWRIDYQMVSPNLAQVATHAHIYKDEKFSDHAPLVVDYDYDFQAA